MISYRLKDIHKIALERNSVSENINYSDYYNFVRLFNRKICKEIIEKNYKFNTGFGIIEIKKKPRTKPIINWGESNKLKQELINKGLTPFNKETSPDGINWFIYYETSITYKWNWFKDGSTMFIKDLNCWKFIPMTGNKKNLGRVISKDPFAELKYGIHT